MANRARNNNRGKDTVLVVDDEAMICESVGMLLSRKSVDSITARTGTEAIEVVKGKGAGLVILDFSLPDMDGLEVLEKIREEDPAIPVVFMTGYGSETVSIRAFKLGISDYFIKPFRPKKLVGKVLDLLGRDEQGEEYEVEELENPPEIENAAEISKVVEYIKNNYTSQVSLEEVANIAGISRYHFTRAFKKVMGIPFSDYLNHLRIKKAEEFLALSNASISQAAYKSGFNSLRQFERTFKKVTGKTPIQFRKERSSYNPA